jgi:hypothetical protein
MNRFIHVAALSILAVAVPTLSISQEPALPGDATFTAEEVLSIIEQAKYGLIRVPQCTNQLDSADRLSNPREITPSKANPCLKASDPHFVCNKTHYRRKQLWATASAQCAFWSDTCPTKEPLCVYAGTKTESELVEDTPIKCECVQDPT